MEQFKVCEKDTKTKAYSKEGLARETKLDPREQEKDDKRAWINECLDNLNDLIEAIEADIEKVSNGKGKGKTWKETVEKYENRILKNRFHITRLEQILKLIDNDDLEPSTLDDIKDDVEYYIECAAEDDGALGVDDEFDIYEDLQLDTVMLEAEEAKIAKSTPGESTFVPSVVESSGIQSDSIKKPIVVSTTTPSVISSIGKPLPPKSSVIPTPVAKSAINSAKSVTSAAVKSPALVPISNTMAPRPIIASTTKIEKKSSPSLDGQNVNNNLIGSMKSPVPESEIKSDSDSSPSISSNSTVTSWAAATQRQSNVVSPVINPQSTNKGPLESPNPNSPIMPTGISLLSNPTSPPQGQGISGPPPVSQSSPQLSSSSTNSAQYPNNGAMSNPETLASVHMLKQSMINLPEGLETEKSTIYTPRNSYNTHPAFPTQPPSATDSAALFERLPMDALFLAFYYQQGTYQQHLASKQLKKHSWRFHKKYMTWFQRHEEPKIASTEFEEGTYVYFDYESGWCQRIKSEFKFEYAYLEDEVLSAPTTPPEKSSITR
jgi:CCR4-NOT transcription complex subunit 3